MKKMMRFMFFIMAVVSIFTLYGCDDEKVRELANQRLRLAQTQLQEARDFEAPRYASELYSLAEIKYAEGKSKVDKSQFDLAIKDWEDFQVLITKAKATAINAREKDKSRINAQEVDQAEALAKLEAERKRLELQTLQAQQARLEAEAKAQVLKDAASAQQVPAITPVVVAAPVVAKPKAKTASTVVGSKQVRILKKGDYLCKIAREEYNGDYMKWVRLFKSNNKSIRNPNLVYPGQAIVIPVK